MSTYYVGWDVGAWHCDNNRKSQDALFISNELRKHLCIRDQLKEATIEDFLNKCLGATDFTNEDSFYFAIDAVFSWPEAVLNLLNKAKANEAIPEKFSTNPFLFRYTEQVISAKLNKQPQSVVQNQIGSQSTKIIFFLQKFNFQREERENIGVWKIPNREIYAIETYPALLDNQDNNTLPNQDLKDAQKCQILAKMFKTTRCKLMSPIEYIQGNTTTKEGDLFKKRVYSEGWIWLPKDKWQNKDEAK